MRTCFRTIFRYAVLGLLTTVVVSWALAVMVEVTLEAQETRQAWSADSPSRWLMDYYRCRGAERVCWRPLFSNHWMTDPHRDRIPLVVSTQAMRSNLRDRLEVKPGLIPAWSRVKQRTPDEMFLGGRDVFDDVIIEDARGWPLLAMRCEFGPKLVHGVQIRRQVRCGIGVPTNLIGQKVPRSEAKALPLMPVWPGFIVNAVLFAAGWWVVLSIPRALLVGWRRFRRRCPGCGYDLRNLTNQRCPECGWRTRASKMPTAPPIQGDRS